MAKAGSTNEEQGSGEPVTARRVFLGWDRPGLAAAADWLLEHRGPDLGDLVVALPGRRAARRLLELLAVAANSASGFVPPEVLTAGRLTDRLVFVDGHVAPQLARTVAWLAVLSEMPVERMAPLIPGGTGPEQPLGWLPLAQELRRLHGELAREGLTFADVQASVSTDPGGAEAERWEVLATIQDHYRARLASANRVDPHLARMAALADGAVPSVGEVVLVGVVDLPRLLRSALARIGDRVSALIVADEDAAADFDACGGVVDPAWTSVEVPFDRATWWTVDKPAHQAEQAAAVFGTGEYAPDEITIGVPDRDVVPFLGRRLARLGWQARDPAGIPATSTGPFRLLHALARWLADPSYEAYASLLRHPDLERCATGDEALSRLDDFHAEHLPHRFGPRLDWVLKTDRPEVLREVRSVHGRVCELIGPDLLDDGARRTPAAWALPLADFVRRVWAGTELDPEVGADRVAIEALAALVDVLEVLAGIEDRDVSAVEALQLVLAGLSEVRLTAAVEDPSVDLLGWLELPLDDAPLLVVTGFNEGRVPQIIHGHAFLPDGLRRRLGLADNQHRLARDAYALTAILRSGRDVHLVTGRRNADGDPLRPSRLVFQTGDDELVVQRVRAFLGPDAPGGEARAPGTEEFKCRPLPRGPVDVPDTIAVTAFSTFLTSPYQYYLTRQLRLDTVGDAERELDGRSFGILVHAVLEEFGQDVEARELSDAEAIERDLIGRLHRHVAAVYGRDPLPAVQIQVLQLVRRLAAFARAQAARRHEGWSVAEVEWAPEQPVPFEVDGVPIGLKGRIDRIDVHGERGWAIIDYKTGDKAADPDRQHRSRGVWKDLQLPLYVLLAESYPAEGRPQLGYGVLPCKPDDAGFRFATWTEDELGSAWDVARDVVRRIRAGELFELGKFKSYEPLIDGIAGLGLLGAGEDEGENS